MKDKPGLPYRVAIENVRPQVDGGRYPIKRVPGDTVHVTADIFADGHDVIAAALEVRDVDPQGATPGAWTASPLEPEPNDRWRGSFVVSRVGSMQFRVQAWIDHFGTWQRDLAKKTAAGLDVSSELIEGALMIRATAERVQSAAAAGSRKRPPRKAAARADTAPPPAAQAEIDWLTEQARLIADPSLPAADRVPRAGEARLSEAMRRLTPHEAVVSLERPLEVLVEPLRARFGAWYEMFPRSYSPEPGRSATFAEAAARLPAIAELGFDVVYLPPVHPIGRTNRKGPNNTLTAGPDDPGSPWAIGSEEGGHMSVHPALGTLDDFDRFVARAGELGLDVALDIAFQCSPDHPYVTSHPEWFRHRPDGTIKYAENPPKKYQDIYPFDFECEAWPSLWDELARVVHFWIDHGVRIFRVDNPHTKSFRFWQWMMADVRRRDPSVVFLSEAFTRPKVMRHLAKIGFSQSYSYFTWRNTKAEIAEYFTELAQTDVREYMRPNLFANTPDILPEYLQRGGRPAFEVRLVLAATLGATYGIYSGFELCENRPVARGSEEYLDSEKYQYKRWDWNRPGRITPLIGRINQVRREHPALQSDWSLRFHPTDNDQIICYSKETADLSDVLLVVVNLDPFRMQHGFVNVPAGDWGLDAAGYGVEDLLSGERYFWRGDVNYVRLDPGNRAAHVLLVQTPAAAAAAVRRAVEETPVPESTLDALTT